jgi:hypothetical protein
MPATRPSALALCAAAALLAASPARAADARDELLRFVPGDVGFCLVVQDLRGHAAAVADSPFAAQLRASAPGAALRESAEASQLRRVDEHMRKQLGLGWEQLRDEVFGDAVVFAYRPGPPGRPEAEEGLFLLRARDGKTLADLVDRLNHAQKESGELAALEERTHAGQRYYRRQDRGKPLFYHLRGPVLLATGQERMLREALDLDRAAGPDAEPPVARQLRLLGAGRALLTLWVNPRAFDEGLDARAAQAAGPEAAVLKTFGVCWKALGGAALALAVDRDVSLTLALRGRSERLPAGVRRFLAEAARPSELWGAFPEKALFACAVRLDGPALLEAVGEFLPPAARQSMAGDLNRALGAPLGRDFVRDVLPNVGPDWGVCVTAPLPEERGGMPRGLAAVRVGRGDEAAPLDQAVLSAVQSFALLAVVGHNAKSPDQPLSLRTAAQGKREVKYLAGDGAFPPGVQPAFGLHSGYLVLASAPEVLRQFTPGPTPAAGSADVPLLRLSFKDWRDYLTERREAVTNALAEQHQLAKEAAERRVDGLLAALQFLDRLDVTQRVTPGRVTFTLTVRPARPLKK